MHTLDTTSNIQPINTTTSLCRVCKSAVPARVIELPNHEVWLYKECDIHGHQQVMLSNNATWYKHTRNIQPLEVAPKTFKKPVEFGCPFDCGPCTSHQQKIRLPVVTITSACNLNCPICYVHNKNQAPYHMALEEFQQVLHHLKQEHGDSLDLINFTGGDPTLHPRFIEFLDISQTFGFHRVSLCTNGILLARDEELVKKLRDTNARVALSFDTFEQPADIQLQGANLFKLKMQCLDLLEKHQVNTTLIPVVSKGVNDHEIGKIIELAMSRSNIRHIEIHTITFTGPGGTSFDRSTRISIHEVLQCIEQQTQGWITVNDFVSSPCAHPLCYQIAYFLLDPEGGPAIPLTRFLDKTTIYECLADRLYLEPTPRLEAAMRTAMENLWLEDNESTIRILRALKHMIADMFPAHETISQQESLRRSERAIKAIYVHSHMDEETFDTERIVQCCDSNCYADGSSIPVCSYNILYREKEQRFNITPVKWQQRSGQMDFSL